MSVRSCNKRLRTSPVATSSAPPGEIAGLRELIAQVRGGNTAAVKDIEHLAHKIYGSGSMFGFEAVSEQARALEAGRQGSRPIRSRSRSSRVTPTRWKCRCRRPCAREARSDEIGARGAQ